MAALDIALYVLAVVLIVAGLIGTLLPIIPGIPMIFGGIWLAAAVDGYRHVGKGWLIALGVLGALGLLVDFLAASMGAKRVGASPQAIWGAMFGTVAGLFFGLPGLLLGPFMGALIGEFVSSGSALRSAHVGVATWVGLLFGTLVKLVISFMMIGLFAFAMLL
jgi:uncharacterized protein